MKKLLFLFLIFSLLTPSYAQFKPKPAAKRPRHRGSVSHLSHRKNKSFHRQIAKISREAAFAPNTLKPEHNVPTTFQLQYSNSPFALAASGFAVKFTDAPNNEGKVWGVTAGHVARRITHNHHAADRKPHIRVATGPNSFVIAPIEKMFIGNPNGMDVALFEIPKEVLPYVHVLSPAEQRPAGGQKITIQGFLEEQAQFFTLSNQKVLLSTPIRTLLEKTPEEELRGFCGSPGLINGRVAMVYVGFDHIGRLNAYDWFNRLPPKTQHSVSNMHYAVPIDVVRRMAKSIEQNGSTSEGGILMKVLDHPIALLHPNESIVFVEQIRNGEIIAKIESDRHFNVNPEQLELFFNFRENDILRLSLDSFSKEHPYPSISIIYEVNVSTGQVIRRTVEDVASSNP